MNNFILTVRIIDNKIDDKIILNTDKIQESAYFFL